ncbi:MAG: hypothetical protein H0U21_00090 [Acidimicrobiia bacterium]|nr:hypothetical protein [Acidimicrobiia bacterium]
MAKPVRLRRLAADDIEAAIDYYLDKAGKDLRRETAGHGQHPRLVIDQDDRRVGGREGLVGRGHGAPLS